MGEENLIILPSIETLMSFDDRHELTYKFYEQNDGSIITLLQTAYGAQFVAVEHKRENVKELVNLLNNKGFLPIKFGPKHWIQGYALI